MLDRELKLQIASKLFNVELANINPRVALDKNIRNIHYSFYFLSASFHAIIIIELLTLFLISGKIWQAFRIIPRLNFITLALESSFKEIL